MTDSEQSAATRDALAAMVAEADTGGRKPTGLARGFIFVAALAWALFQLWYASPLPYVLHFAVFNDGEARIVHLSFARSCSPTRPFPRGNPRRATEFPSPIGCLRAAG